MNERTHEKISHEARSYLFLGKVLCIIGIIGIAVWMIAPFIMLDFIVSHYMLYSVFGVASWFVAGIGAGESIAADGIIQTVNHWYAPRERHDVRDGTGRFTKAPTTISTDKPADVKLGLEIPEEGDHGSAQ